MVGEVISNDVRIVPALAVNDLKVSFGSHSVLNGVSFQIDAETTVGLIGPNGSGKTTLFNCLSGFVHLASGQISVHGTPVTDYSAHQRAQVGLGRVFQNFGIFREMTLLENVVCALEGKLSWFDSILPYSATQRRIQNKAMEFLREVGLQDKAKQKAASLSGGQMRLLEIIRCVAFEASVLLLDEPTAGVSPVMKETIAELILKLRSLGKTVLVIEHDIQFIQRFCSRVIVLESGRVVLDGTPDQVRNDPRLQEIYFGTAPAGSEERQPQARVMP